MKKLDKLRNDIAYDTTVWLMRHVATKEFGNRFFEKLVDKGRKSESGEQRAFFPQGTRLRSKCPECKRFFEQGIALDSNIPKSYCSDRCKKNRADRLRGAPAKECPTPHKTKYPRFETAQKSRVSFMESNFDTHRALPYKCECQNYHLGRTKYTILKEGKWRV